MAKRSPNRDKAKEMWLNNRLLTPTDIGKELGVAASQVRKWKHLDEWERCTGMFPAKRAIEKVDRLMLKEVDKNDNLTDREKTFCLYWVKTFNGAAAARAAGYSPETARWDAWKLLQLPHIQREIDKLKQMRLLALMADAEDVVMLHMRIAFADLGLYADWGQEAVPVFSESGELITVPDSETGEAVPLERTVNYVNFKRSDEVDTQLVSSVKVGRDGASIKLRDPDKSMAFLGRYFTLNPSDKHKMEFDAARLELERKRVEPEDQGDVADDGFVDALNAAAGEVWSDEDQGDIPV